MDSKAIFFDPRLYSAVEISRMVGSRVRALRQSRSLRQLDLAKAVGVTLPTISRLEKTGKVGFDVVIRVAIALGAEAELANLFSQPKTRSIDEIIATQRPRYRVRRMRRSQ
ncbi:MAG: helix-turn-helix domain-containing protein [Candidatus Eremiobacteraeota bacterium]|nr:helix-turn-helix domain-containing protein [Candidatus Eremiobacteraeota bacterium]